MYPALPLAAEYKSGTLWDKVEKIFMRKLYMWKRHYISKGGRLHY